MNENMVGALKRWFSAQFRDLPWRNSPSPYAVWVSEVMLQQTQVSVVIPYFERWMRLFPTVEALAASSIEVVLKEWEGLGYYARARNLHQGARYVVDQYNGKIPETADSLKQIKGLGEYTVGAILSFAFHQRAAAVDGNVMRVLSRYYCLSDDISQGKTQKKLRGIAYDLLPIDEPWVVSEALIELGATVCTRSPKCRECPLVAGCLAFAQGKANQLPVKSAKTVSQALHRLVAVVRHQGHLLVKRGEKGKVMADLFEFPYFEVVSSEIPVEDQIRSIKKQLKKEFALDVKWQQGLPQVKHSFTRYRVSLVPHLFTVNELQDIQGHDWISIDELKKRPFSAGHRRIFDVLQDGLRLASCV
ncbi:MAG: A/G-specific adenine glycosylase [Parachlamydiaceae bacterium]